MANKISAISALRLLVEAQTPSYERDESWDEQWEKLAVAAGEKCCIGGQQWGHASNCPTLP